MYIICLNNGTVIPATTGRAIDELLHATANTGVNCRIPLNQIKQAWELQASETLPVEQLKAHTHLAAAILDIESAIQRYTSDHPDDTFVNAEGALIFGAAALTLSILPTRTSEDIDVALSPEFLQWAAEHWQDQGYTQMDITDTEILQHCGNWRSRTSRLRATQYSFRLLHPLDIVMQKLLRRDPIRFEEKDIPDIENVIKSLNPTTATLEHLLTENHSRYLPNPRDHLEPRQYDAVVSNTNWLLSRFLPHTTIDEISERAYRRVEISLARAHLLPNQTKEERNLRDVIPLIPSSIPRRPNHH